MLNAITTSFIMVASWYGPGFHGNYTANGEIYDQYGSTAAHKSLPFGTRLEVCYETCEVVRINDRGPFIPGRDLDISHGTANRIGMTSVGVAEVQVKFLD